MCVRTRSCYTGHLSVDDGRLAPVAICGAVCAGPCDPAVAECVCTARTGRDRPPTAFLVRVIVVARFLDAGLGWPVGARSARAGPGRWRLKASVSAAFTLLVTMAPVHGPLPLFSHHHLPRRRQLADCTLCTSLLPARTPSGTSPWSLRVSRRSHHSHGPSLTLKLTFDRHLAKILYPGERPQNGSFTELAVALRPLYPAAVL